MEWNAIYSTDFKRGRIVMITFWEKLRRPFFVLAPMANVTDSAFRQIVARHAKPDVFWTEFVSADGLCSRGAKHLAPDLYFTQTEHPIVLQLFGANPDNFYKAAQYGRELGFDGIDINTGCPDKTIEKQGAGAALIKNPSLVKEIVVAAKEGARGLPISIKTRIGYNKDVTEKWIEYLLKTEPVVLTIHARTRKQMSNVPASWEAISKAVKLRNSLGSKTFVIGNGDVLSLNQAKLLTQKTGCEGIMFGRAVFGNPWLFSRKPRLYIPIKERLLVLVEHTELFEKIFTGVKNFALMKKHFKAYVADFDGAKTLRIELMKAENAKEVKKIVEEFLTLTHPL